MQASVSDREAVQNGVIDSGRSVREAVPPGIIDSGKFSAEPVAPSISGFAETIEMTKVFGSMFTRHVGTPALCEEV